ncbi:MAG TPA: Mur ligase family protein, partial [Chloroflexota bacterium]|nr:Mur ligase family protein [Chloroflexota bacterium]
MQTTLSDFTASISYLEELAARPILSWRDVGLQRMMALFAALGDPQRRFATIQVAGTAGKGSTTTMAAAILRAAGYRTGAFTSPHLQSYRERIAIDGEPIDEGSWLRAMRTVQPIAERMARNELPGYTLGRPAFLEILWAMAGLIFVEHGVQCAVVETGVGGRVDPTTINVASVAVITNVSLDHVERLGPTIEAIAAEKAGLIKPGQIVVSAACGNALEVIRATCAARGATLWHVDDAGERAAIAQAEAAPGEAAVILTTAGTAPNAPITVRTPPHTYHDLTLRLRGAHQRLNAACAVAAVDAFAEQEGLAVTAEAVATGLASAVIPGRMEYIAGAPAILLDGAKSPAAAAALAEALRTLYAGRRIILVLGMLSHKDLKTMTDLLTPLAAAVIVTEPPWEHHAALADQVAALARTHVAQVEQIQQVPDALERARQLAGPDDLIVVAGSLILVGA